MVFFPDDMRLSSETLSPVLRPLPADHQCFAIGSLVSHHAQLMQPRRARAILATAASLENPATCAPFIPTRIWSYALRIGLAGWSHIAPRAARTKAARIRTNHFRRLDHAIRDQCRASV